jgi:hypothetical protein
MAVDREKYLERQRRYNLSEKGRARWRRYAQRKRAAEYAARTPEEWEAIAGRRRESARKAHEAWLTAWDSDQAVRWKHRSACIEAGLRRARDNIERKRQKRIAEGRVYLVDCWSDTEWKRWTEEWKAKHVRWVPRVNVEDTADAPIESGTKACA